MPRRAHRLREVDPAAREARGGSELDLPGHPVSIATPGHTSGHTMFAFSRQRVLVTGDALMTGHGTSGVHGPQLLARPFHHNVAEAVGSLDALRGRGHVTILPGHGDPFSGDADELVDLALSRPVAH
ncbi:MBL fold metallo-hydrolase [Actinoplanes sp. NPDC049265]|uniref:MBL fold metallo-hydrolase n=1 Tax=Actinoplanes sp. NPDC049265 TaxID=3363902 RepID=UPI003723B44C